ncbi:MAG: C40 family peptidase [Muribaculaceae bacterium]|nr:C40 family peptidase [Muribaculaceae bacterium]
MIVAAVTPVAAVEKNAAGKNANNVSVSQAADADEMTYASISRTNPFEIVPAAGMELLMDEDGSEASEMVADMISYAKKFLGTRYVRGGKSPKGFDCSGFTSYVFSQFGYSLSASSAAQYGQGEKLERDEISAGDLLFFTGRNSRSGRVGHVGIALSNDPETGEITFIHAAISGGIRIDRISAPYYAARFIGAKRVL